MDKEQRENEQHEASLADGESAYKQWKNVTLCAPSCHFSWSADFSSSWGVYKHSNDFVGMDMGEVKPGKLIAFAGKQGAGKTTISRMVKQELGGRIVPFAAPIKDMLASVGVDQRHLYGTQDEKLEPVELLCGKSARYALQTLGTEWGRETIGQTIWTGMWTKRVRELLESGCNVYCDDVRFPSEIDLVNELGGTVFYLVGRGHIATKPKRSIRKPWTWFTKPHSSELIHNNPSIYQTVPADNSTVPQDCVGSILSFLEAVE